MRLLLVVVAALALVACKKPESPVQAAPVAAPTAPAAGAITGKVLEKTDAPPYSYLKLATGSGEVWAAVPQTPTAVGTEVTVANAFPMKDFESKTLNKKFELVYFGTLGGDAAAAAPAMPPMGGPTGATGNEMPSPVSMAAQHQAAATAPAVKVGKIAKAGGPEGKTVEEVWTHRTALKEKPVVVKGQVVKFSPGIMNRNWIHLQDGTGHADKKNNDITVTTQDDVKVGDVVTVKGTVRLDKDFGAGYAYPVIIEDAKITGK